MCNHLIFAFEWERLENGKCSNYVLFLTGYASSGTMDKTKSIIRHLPACGLTMLDKQSSISLREYLRKVTLKPSELLIIMRRVIEELNILHDMGLVHGNLSIGKIYLSGFSTVSRL